MDTSKKVLLLVLSGFGLSETQVGNAVRQAVPEFLQKLFQERPFSRLEASGLNVGLPHGEPGNSEAGFLAIGAGRIIEQEQTRINRSIEDRSFFENVSLTGFMQQIKAQGRALHLSGLLSDGNLHSRTTHLYALLEMARNQGLNNVFVHVFTDGRNSDSRCGLNVIKDLQEEMKKIGVGRIATISGRYYAMDRDGRWDRLEKVYQAISSGMGNHASDPIDAIDSSYKVNVTDEFILPVVITESGSPIATIANGDGLLAFNHRSDRIRQFIRMFTEPGFPHFKINEVSPRVAGLVPLAKKFPFPVGFEQVPVDGVLGQILAESGIKQFRLAETENYANITYFLNGRLESPFNDEERFLIPTSKVGTYDLKPEMSAFEIGDLLMEKIQTSRFPFVLANFANCDAVGHTGNLEAAVKAVVSVDSVLSKVIPVAYNAGYDCMICSDHGNVEKMIDPDSGKPFPGHTSNLVPLSLLSRNPAELRPEGGLADIAPTILDLFGLAAPAAMTGKSLLTSRK